jgi:hypothetical protein
MAGFTHNCFGEQDTYARGERAGILPSGPGGCRGWLCIWRLVNKRKVRPILLAQGKRRDEGWNVEYVERLMVARHRRRSIPDCHRYARKGSENKTLAAGQGKGKDSDGKKKRGMKPVTVPCSLWNHTRLAIIGSVNGIATCCGFFLWAGIKLSRSVNPGDPCAWLPQLRPGGVDWSEKQPWSILTFQMSAYAHPPIYR